MRQITNIHVDNIDTVSRRAAARWQDGEARYHAWFNLDTKEINEHHRFRDGAVKRVIYKNPISSAGQHFGTRMLDISVNRKEQRQ